MNRFVLRVHDELFEKVRAQAARQGVSINQYLLYTITRTVSAEETRAFGADYEAARGVPLTADELRAAHAAAVYVRAYATRCGHALGGTPHRAAVEAYAEALL